MMRCVVHRNAHLAAAYRPVYHFCGTAWAIQPTHMQMQPEMRLATKTTSRRLHLLLLQPNFADCGEKWRKFNSPLRKCFGNQSFFLFTIVAM
jgi:hypothetical protein